MEKEQLLEPNPSSDLVGGPDVIPGLSHGRVHIRFPGRRTMDDEEPHPQDHGLWVLSAAHGHARRDKEKPAVIDVGTGRTFTYTDLLVGAAAVRQTIVERLRADDSGDVQEQRIAFLVPASADYVNIQWGTWAAGGVAVPLCTSHPFAELEYVVADSKPSLIFLHQDFAQHKPAFQSTFPSIPIIDVPFPHAASPQTPRNPRIDPSRQALIIYTSGTTSKPKGCVSTHANIAFQATSLVQAWHYTPSDHLIHVLPLHHVHGIINGLTATLLAGGTVELHPKFDASAVWQRWMDGDSTLFMAVPTVYARLNSHFTQRIAGTADEARAIDGAKRLRLAVSGSAALPTTVKARFHEITGQVLLERYGMTEVGMALSCRYDNADGNGRPDGSVGWPLDGVYVRLMSDDGVIIPPSSETEGEIQIRGANVFEEYWERPDATAKEFTDDGFFKTGDIAIRTRDGAYYIRGRSSVDIIKSGGYKISALDVERELLSAIPHITEAAVVGIPDDEWGERVAAVISLEDTTQETGVKEYRDLLRDRLAPYKIPTVWKVVERIERNAMGKVNKKQLVKDLWP
ncbi:hypothetical protein Dda_6678 [Drechslerella dactyloides]|uniref:Peroxisomal AMP binding enzyme n=1 Tax=Drechslerella dactyloides TaxID=74499 RepID=A0AAD6IW10_DREDA|nr:hypothetical protein Dda_6678 [Drechslerella dactyloides]